LSKKERSFSEALDEKLLDKRLVGRPFQYLQEKVKKDDLARQIAERDHIDDGLICVLSVLEPCRTFSFRTEKGKPFVASARRKCLFLYYYFMDRDFGLIHVKLQTWFPLQIQVYVNGHEWLARKLKENGIRYTKYENAFLWIEDMARAQAFSDRFASLEWPRILNPYARKVNPLMEDLLESMPYYWVTAQSEYSTDILFKSASHLSELYPRLLSHSTLCFGAKEVMSFLGKKIRSQFEGEVVTDVSDLSFKRIAGSRIKHRVKQNYVACRTMSRKTGSEGRDPYGARLCLGRSFNCTRHSLNGFTASYELSRPGIGWSPRMICFARISGLMGDWPPKWIRMVLMEACLLVKSHPQDDTRTMSSL
jgi:hypothetical protein